MYPSSLWTLWGHYSGDKRNAVDKAAYVSQFKKRTTFPRSPLHGLHTWLESPVQVSGTSHSFTASLHTTPLCSYWDTTQQSHAEKATHRSMDNHTIQFSLTNTGCYRWDRLLHYSVKQLIYYCCNSYVWPNQQQCRTSDCKESKLYPLWPYLPNCGKLFPSKNILFTFCIKLMTLQLKSVNAESVKNEWKNLLVASQTCTVVQSV